MQDKYLINLTEEREREAIEIVVRLPFISSDFFRSLGLNSCFSWYLLRIDRRYLEKSPPRKARDGKPGDVDILAGPLRWKEPEKFEALIMEEAKVNPNRDSSWHYFYAALKLAESGGIEWPPSMDYLIGIEVKCRPKKLSEGKIEDTREQINGLLNMGFDRVALLDIIPNKPADGIDGQAWITAACEAEKSKEERYSDTKMILPEDCPAGLWMLSIGAVCGKCESMSGARSMNKLRNAPQNPFLMYPDVKSRRLEMEDMLSKYLTGLTSPQSFPAIFINPDFNS